MSRFDITATESEILLHTLEDSLLQIGQSVDVYLTKDQDIVPETFSSSITKKGNDNEQLNREQTVMTYTKKNQDVISWKQLILLILCFNACFYVPLFFLGLTLTINFFSKNDLKVQKVASYVNSLLTHYVRQSRWGINTVMSTRMKVLANIFFFLYVSLVQVGFWGSVAYQIITQGEAEPQIVDLLVSVIKEDWGNNIYDIVNFSIICVCLSSVLLIVAVTAMIAGHNHQLEHLEKYKMQKLEKCVINWPQFKMEFFTQRIGDPILSYLLYGSQNYSDRATFTKKWVNMYDLITCVLYTVNDRCLANCQIRFLEAYHQKNTQFKYQRKLESDQLQDVETPLNNVHEFETTGLNQQTSVCDSIVAYLKNQGRFSLYDKQSPEIQMNNQAFVQYLIRRYQLEGQDEKIGFWNILVFKFLKVYQWVKTEGSYYYLVPFAIVLTKIILMTIFIYRSGEATQNIRVLLFFVAINFLVQVGTIVTVINCQINQKKMENTQKRLLNMILWVPDKSFVIPKEVPTMNIFCQVSWQTWFDSKRYISSLFTREEKNWNSLYSFLLFYVLLCILFMVFDQYAVFWRKNRYLQNDSMFYSIFLDIVLYGYYIAQKLLRGCERNEMQEVQVEKIKDFQLFLSNILHKFEQSVSFFMGQIYDDKQKLLPEAQLKVNFQNLSQTELKITYSMVHLIRECKLFLSATNDQTEVKNVNEEQVSYSRVRSYIASLLKTLDRIQVAIVANQEATIQRFIGIIPINYVNIKGITLSIAPTLLGIFWTLHSKHLELKNEQKK